MPKEIKKHGSSDISKLIKRISVMPDDKLLDIYRNIDWDDYVMIDVAVLCGEIGSRGYDIVEEVDEDNNCILSFKTIPLMKKGDKVA